MHITYNIIITYYTSY